uniref:Heterogeneous nuclear ribonucleoprotein U-like protein 1 n=1 Tax=Euglena gracilis TaxID=3039 RepID=A0AA51UAL4_EUGGR|nr:heterogeneous nuclear ribonucleoprotein U-like protein 1 [Euglena gracilis]BDX17174.1 E1B-55 kDa-associated protein 5A [Euglena gracilis]
MARAFHTVRKPPSAVRLALNPDDKDLDFIVRPDGQGGRSMDDFMWSGCRANYGAPSGRVAFLMQVDSGSLCRVGWGTASAALALGQCEQSFGYGGTGKKSHNNQFVDYGEPFGCGDCIIAWLDWDMGEIGFYKNDVDLDVAWLIPDWLHGVPLFPHVLTKNCAISLFFGPEPGVLMPPLPVGFCWLSESPNLIPSPWGATRQQALALGYAPPVKDEDRDAPEPDLDRAPYAAGPDLEGAGPNQQWLIMLVGLPCSGKTYWAKQFIRQHPELKFQILSTNLIMERKMPNTKHMYADRFNKLIQEATEILQQQLKVASREMGNIIWDQTNVYPTARRRKLADFRGFRKTAVVFLPDMDTLAEWRVLQFEQTGQRVPDRVVAEFQKAFTLPEVGDEAGFDEVVYAFGNSPANRRQIMQAYKAEADAYYRGEKKRGPLDLPEDAPQQKVFKKDDYLKSYGERQFTASNPYRPDLPYRPEQQRLPPPQRQLALLRDALADGYGGGRLAAKLPRPPAASATPSQRAMGRLPVAPVGGRSAGFDYEYEYAAARSSAAPATRYNAPPPRPASAYRTAQLPPPEQYYDDDGYPPPPPHPAAAAPRYVYQYAYSR